MRGDRDVQSRVGPLSLAQGRPWEEVTSESRPHRGRKAFLNTPRFSTKGRGFPCDLSGPAWPLDDSLFQKVICKFLKVTEVTRTLHGHHLHIERECHSIGVSSRPRAKICSVFPLATGGKCGQSRKALRSLQIIKQGCRTQAFQQLSLPSREFCPSSPA